MIKDVASVFSAGLLLAGTMALPASTAVATGKEAGTVNVYSYREPGLTKPLFEAFTKDTGIKVNVLFVKKGLIERIAAEGALSPADVLLTADIGLLTKAVDAGIAQAVTSEALTSVIPAALRDPEGYWFGLTRRARVIIASKDRVKQNAITYEELADPKWKGKICSRPGQHVYNIAMIASMIAHHGEAKTKTWLQGFKANLARRPSGNDRAQVKSVFTGECDLAVSNTYYMGLMQTNDKKPEQKKWASAVKVLFPNANGRGTHINLSGMVMSKHAKNKANAMRLMAFLASNKAQKMYAERNFEYPVVKGVGASQRVKSWGDLKADPLPLAEIAKLRKRASELVDETGFNKGP